jgi:hypothetical protein
LPSEHQTISSVIAQVEALIAGGALTRNQGAGLIAKLEGVNAKLDRGKSGPPATS